MDAWGAGAAGSDTQRKEDEPSECPAGAIRFSGIYIRTAHQSAGRGEYIGYSPSNKSVARIKQKVGELLEVRNGAPWEEVCQKLNQKLQGWRQYFHCGSTGRA